MIAATTAVTQKTKGSELVLKFVDTFKHLEKETSLLEFLTMLTGQISSKVHGECMVTQTPQMDVFPHPRTMICNTKKYGKIYLILFCSI
jgi:hypothetical protein